MGCDIHLVLERKTGDGWLGIHNFPYYDTREGSDWPLARERNYDRFAALAGVRGEGPEPKGIPQDASPLARYESEEWGDDGHSHSWLPVDEAAKIFLATERLPNDWCKQYPADFFFGVNDDHPGEYRIVFWFDN